MELRFDVEVRVSQSPDQSILVRYWLSVKEARSSKKDLGRTDRAACRPKVLYIRIIEEKYKFGYHDYLQTAPNI